MKSHKIESAAVKLNPRDSGGSSPASWPWNVCSNPSSHRGQFQDIALKGQCVVRPPGQYTWLTPVKAFSISFEDAGGWMHRSIHLWAPNKTHLWVWLLPPATYSSGVVPFFLLSLVFMFGVQSVNPQYPRWISAFCSDYLTLGVIQSDVSILS